MTGIRESIEARSAELADGGKGYIRQRGIKTRGNHLKGGGFGRKSAAFGKSFSGCYLAREWVFRYQEGKQPYGMCITDKVGSVRVFLGFS